MLPFGVRDSSFLRAARCVRFRGLISGREIVNTLKSRTANPFNDISAICLKRPGPPFDANTAKSRARAVQSAGVSSRTGGEEGRGEG